MPYAVSRFKPTDWGSNWGHWIKALGLWTLGVVALFAGANRPPAFAKTEHKLRMVVGNEVRTRLPEAKDPDGDPVSYGIDALPPGLSFDPKMRIISGSPSKAETFKCSYVAKNAHRKSTRLPITIAIMIPIDGDLEPNYVEITNPSEPFSVFAGQLVSFEAWSFGGTKPKWIFGDGTVYANGFSVSHTFQAAGTFNVRFNVLSDGIYSSGSALVTITVLTPPPPSSITSVKVAPDPVLITLGESQIFKATVAGTGNYNGGVTWSVLSGVGSISALKGWGLYTSTVTGSATLIATSTQDGTKFGMAYVTVLPPTVTSVTVNPSNAFTKPGVAKALTATVSGTGSYSSAVTWVLVAGVGGINASTGEYSSSVLGTATVKATSIQDGTKFGIGTVTVQNAPGPMAWKRDIVYLGAKEVAEVDVKGAHVTLTDHLGSPRILVNPDGSTVAQKFMPFGEPLADPTTMSKFGKGFTNHEQTDPSGLIYMQARFYLPMYHRFLSPDPGLDQHFEQTQSWNIYSYVRNNPIMSTDPTGMMDNATMKMDRDSGAWKNADKAPASPGEAKVAGFVAAGMGLVLAGPAMEAGGAATAALRASASTGTLAQIGAGITGTFNAAKDKLSQAKDAVVQAASSTKDAVSNLFSRSGATFDWNRAGHVFRESEGHLNPSTPAGRQAAAQMFEGVTQNAKNLVDSAQAVQRGLMTADAAKNGVQAFVQTTKQGQVWALTRGDKIINAGVNALKDQR